MFMVGSKQSARKTEKKAIRNALASKTDLFFFAFFVKRRSARGERKGESRIRWVLFFPSTRCYANIPILL